MSFRGKSRACDALERVDLCCYCRPLDSALIFGLKRGRKGEKGKEGKRERGKEGKKERGKQKREREKEERERKGKRECSCKERDWCYCWQLDSALVFSSVKRARERERKRE